MLNYIFKNPVLLYGIISILTISITLLGMVLIMIKIYNYNNNQSMVFILQPPYHGNKVIHI